MNKMKELFENRPTNMVCSSIGVDTSDEPPEVTQDIPPPEVTQDSHIEVDDEISIEVDSEIRTNKCK